MSEIAMDVHRKRSMVAYQSPLMVKPQTVGFLTGAEELAEVLGLVPRPWVVCLEATRQSPAVVRWLRELGVDEIHLVDPTQLRAFVKGKPKSDKRDALEMLGLLQIRRLPESYLAPEEVQQLRALTRTRGYVRRGSSSLRNQLRAVLNQHGLEVPARDLCGVSGQRQLRESIGELEGQARTAAEQLRVLLVDTEAALNVLDGAMIQEMRQQPIAEELTKLPGVGQVLALALVAEIGDIDRFEDPAHLIGYAGLGPRANDSDEHHGERHLPKRCSKRLRHLAVQAAQAACRTDGPVRRTYLRLRARGLNHNSAKIAAARVLLKNVFWRWKQALAADRKVA